MILPDRMFSSEWIRDLRLRRLPAHVQLLLIFLRPLCDRNGRFEFNPALIHMALYASADCSNVSARDVEAWLEILRSGGFIKSYTGAAGRRVGEVAREYWRQKLNFGKDVYDPEHEQPELPLPADDPPDKKISKRGGRISPPPFTSLRINSEPPKLDPAAETDEEWLARLVIEWPGIDVAAQLTKAHRKRKGDVERVWFENVWLPGVSPMAALPSRSAAPAAPVEIEAEPEAWRQHLKDHHEGEGWAESAAMYPWPSLSAEWRAKIAREMKRQNTRAA